MMKLIALALSLTLLTGCTWSAGPLMLWGRGNAVILSEDADRFYADGMDAFHRTDYALAQEKFQAAVEANPKMAAAWLGLAGSYDYLRRFDLADRAYREVERLTGPTPSLLNNRGYSHYLQGNLVKARALYEEAARLAPNDPIIAANIEMLHARKL